MSTEHLYIVFYDVRDQRRWRKLYKIMRGFGEWVQLSVFQCRLDAIHKLRLEDAIRGIVKNDEDHVLIMDLGPADNVRPRVHSIGLAFEPLRNESVIV